MCTYSCNSILSLISGNEVDQAATLRNGVVISQYLAVDDRAVLLVLLEEIVVADLCWKVANEDARSLIERSLRLVIAASQARGDGVRVNDGSRITHCFQNQSEQVRFLFSELSKALDVGSEIHARRELTSLVVRETNVGLGGPVDCEQDDLRRCDGKFAQRFGKALLGGALGQSYEGQLILVLTSRPWTHTRRHRGVCLCCGGLGALSALFLLLLLHCISNSTTLIFQITNEHPIAPDLIKFNIP